MSIKKLEINVKGEDYDEIIELILDGEIICQKYTYCFITTYSGEGIEIELDFSRMGKDICHVLKRSGDYILFIPDIEDCLKYSALGKDVIKFPLIVDYQAIRKMWIDLQYDPSELATVETANSRDYTFLWFLNIFFDLKIGYYDDLLSLVTKILTEDPISQPTVSSIVDQLIKGKIEFVNNSLVYADSLSPVVVYLDNSEKQLVEWQALDANDRSRILLGDGWSVNYRVTS